MRSEFPYHALLMLIALCMVNPLDTIGDTAPVAKNPPQKSTQAKIDSVPGRRVLVDFRGAYTKPEGSTEKRVSYAGGIRTLRETREGTEIPVQVHRISVDLLLDDCGLTIRDTWEVLYYRLESEWIFDRIALAGSREVGIPKKKMPVLDDRTALPLIRTGLGKSHPEWELRDLVILKKAPSWKRCTARNLVTSRASLARHDKPGNTITIHECLFRSMLEDSGKGWEYAGDSCVYRGKDRSDCFIGTMCRKISVESSLPPPDDGAVGDLLRDALQSEYGLKKNNIDIERFEIISKSPPEQFNTRIDFTVRTVFSIDEKREVGGDSMPVLVKVRAVYECLVRAFILYDKMTEKWRAIIESCCADGNIRCDFSCSYPDKGCLRLGEK